MALRSVQHGWREARFRSTWDNYLPSQSAGPARAIGLLAEQSNILLWRWPARSPCSCEWWTEGTHLAGQARNLISWERTSSWSQPMIGFCPEAEGLSVLANFIQKKDKQAHSSFSYQPRVAEVEEVQSVVSLVPEHHLGHTGGPAGRKLFLNRPNLTRFSFWQELSC